MAPHAYEILIREAKPDDFGDVFELVLELRSSHGEKGKLDKQGIRPIFQRYLSNSDKYIYVAESRGLLVGFMSITIGESLYEDKPWAEVDELVVKEGYRSQGLGGRLLDEVFRIAHERQCNVVVLAADINNARAIEFYGELGFKSGEIVLEKELAVGETDGGLG